jgi:hypothetical protein
MAHNNEKRDGAQCASTFEKLAFTTVAKHAVLHRILPKI